MSRHTSDAARECLQLLGAEAFDVLAAQMVHLPKRVDHDAVYTAIAEGARYLLLHQILNPDYVRDQDEALAAIGQAIEKFKKVVQRRPTGPAAEPLPDYLKGWWPGKYLEREHKALMKDWLLRAGRTEILDEAPPSKKGGRPRAAWRTTTEAALLGLGVTREAAKGLLDAAGLTGPRPRRP